MCSVKLLCVVLACVVATRPSVESASIGLAAELDPSTQGAVELLVQSEGEVDSVRSKREPVADPDPKHHHHHGGFGGFGGGSGSAASASAGSGSHGGYGGGGSQSHASAQSQSFSFGPLSASFSQASAGSQSHSSGGLFDGLF